MDASGRQPFSHFFPKERGKFVADNTIQDPAGLLGVNQILVYFARVFDGRLDRGFRDLVEFDALIGFGRFAFRAIFQALARTIHPETIPTDSVGIGSAVVLKPAAGGPELRLTFLGPWESDVTKNVFSYQTAMAQDMMGKIVGDTVDLKMEGLEGTYTIERIEAGM